VRRYDGKELVFHQPVNEVMKPPMQMIWQTEVNNCNLNQNWLNRKIVFPFRLPFLSLLIPHVAQLEVPKEMKMGLR